MSEYLLQMKGIDKSFGGTHALDHVDFAISPGRVMCLAGENGCGKSTLVKIISGVYTKDDGEVYFEDKLVEHITPAEATRLGIQVIYQDLSFFPNGLAVIIISDDLAEVVVNCARVLVMKSGKIVGEMEGKDITEENIREIIM